MLLNDEGISNFDLDPVILSGITHANGIPLEKARKKIFGVFFFLHVKKNPDVTLRHVILCVQRSRLRFSPGLFWRSRMPRKGVSSSGQ